MLPEAGSSLAFGTLGSSSVRHQCFFVLLLLYEQANKLNRCAKITF